MAEYGSKEFIELWRQKGLFVALESSPTHGKYTRDVLRRAVTTQTQHKISEMRKQLSAAQAMLERLDQNIMAGTRGGKVEQTHVEANVVEMAERVRSFADVFQGMKWFLSEGSYRKSWIQTERQGATYTSQSLVP